ncbi:hypothetical protein [Streptomyces sp. NPDC058108]|uniref:hypothetical protein n=1 Tax=Streptomyces sp. NPDC058108 TaxID=3346344 RepID=UPI0036E33C2E
MSWPATATGPRSSQGLEDAAHVVGWSTNIDKSFEWLIAFADRGLRAMYRRRGQQSNVVRVPDELLTHLRLMLRKTAECHARLLGAVLWQRQPTCGLSRDISRERPMRRWEGCRGCH